jgi:hypothetical protein
MLMRTGQVIWINESHEAGMLFFAIILQLYGVQSSRSKLHYHLKKLNMSHFHSPQEMLYGVEHYYEN